MKKSEELELFQKLMKGMERYVSKEITKNISLRDELRELLFALRVMRKNEEEKVKNSKPRLFQAGDRVFDIRYGWGTVRHVNMRDSIIHVFFDRGYSDIYLEDGRYFFNEYPSLSHKEYSMND